MDGKLHFNENGQVDMFPEEADALFEQKMWFMGMYAIAEDYDNCEQFAAAMMTIFKISKKP